jgi:hypothetical protein
MKKLIPKIAATLLTFFALITLFMSSSVIFDLFGIREIEGNYVLSVVISNFICGFLYLISAYGLFFQKRWTTRLLFIAACILLVSFAGLLWHINMGGIYEKQTVKAMLFRIAITFAFALLSWRYISKETVNQAA